jgi:hypothetical protein
MFEYYDEGKDVLHFGGVSSNCWFTIAYRFFLEFSWEIKEWKIRKKLNEQSESSHLEQILLRHIRNCKEMYEKGNH